MVRGSLSASLPVIALHPAVRGAGPALPVVPPAVRFARTEARLGIKHRSARGIPAVYPSSRGTDSATGVSWSGAITSAYHSSDDSGMW